MGRRKTLIRAEVVGLLIWRVVKLVLVGEWLGTSEGSCKTGTRGRVVGAHLSGVVKLVLVGDWLVHT